MPLTPEQIEKLRENSHIRLDRDGRFWHEGEPVEHPLVAQAFHRGLGRAPDGRPTISFGRTWCYIQAEGTLYLARTVACTAGAGGALQSCLVRLDDGTEETIVPSDSNVGIDAEGTLYVKVRNGREWARLLPAAQAELGRWAEAGHDGRLGLLTEQGSIALQRVDRTG